MSNLTDEAVFFNEIAPKIRELVQSFHGKASISVQKTPEDYATEVDIAVENLIVNEIQARFPNDQILAEEGHNDTVIPDSRIWIIDPICGTGNIGRGLTSFCSNIALADNGILIASCVVDHSQNDYFWSVGDNIVYINDGKLQPLTKPEGLGVVIDVDMGAANNLSDKELTKYVAFLRNIITGTTYMPQSLNTSLGFAYTAIGKIDGFVNTYNHPWDICASVFLLQQVGGIITDLDGNPWNIESVGAIGAKDPLIHSKLVELYTK
ncbi:MAG: inositol monophosphatase [Candidatus Saccharibacteria bacterium]|nr:inositol monophosphatase [Candidatus Saccharibacteria bacterium]